MDALARLLALFLAALAAGCGVHWESLQWTTAAPARADLTGEWRPGESMDAVLREEWSVPSAPIRCVLDDDGTARVDGFDLLAPDDGPRDAAKRALRAGAPLATSVGTWRVEAAPGGYRTVVLRVGDREVGLRSWGLSPPYSLSGTLNDDPDPDRDTYLFLVRPADDARRSALAPVVDAPGDPTAGDGFLEVTARIVLAAVLVVLIVAAAVLVVVALAAFVVAAVATGAAVVAALAAGGALGIAATSALVGLLRRSAAAGFRAFLTLTCAAPGAALGAAAGWAARRVLRGPAPGDAVVVDAWVLGGLLAGAIAGALVGRFAAIALERAARWAAARFGGGVEASPARR